MVGPLPVVRVDEVPPERIRASIDTYRWLFGEEGWRAARASAPAIAEALASIEPRWLDELSTWAAAAAVDLDDLLVLNARSEVLSLVRADRRRGECTVVAEVGRVGQTWDWYERQRPAMVVLRTDGFVAVTEAGMLAKLGVNRHGVAVGLAYLASTSDRLPGDGSLPVHAILRLLLERSADVPDALATLEGLRLAGSACIALADRSGAALVEISPAGRAVLPDGVHTNHCLDGGLRRLAGPVSFLDDSEARHARAEELWRQEVALDDLLADTTGGFCAIDQPPDPALDVRDRTATVLAVVMDAERRLLRIAPGRPSQTGFSQVVDL